MTITLVNSSFNLSPGGDGILRSASPAGLGIVGVSGAITDGTTVTVTGGGFGPDGPANYVFENFEAGTLGADGTTANTSFDTISQYWPPVFVSDSRSGSLAAEMSQFKNIAPFDFAASINGFNFASTTEVFTSYAVKVPAGKYFPGKDGGNAGTNADYSTDSSWKMSWLLGREPSPTAINDLVTLTHVGGGTWHTAGNDLGVLINHGNNPSWWKWGDWNRVSTWVKAGAAPEADAGNLYFQIANGTDAITETVATPVVFGSHLSAGEAAPYDWLGQNFAGWIREDGVGGAGGSDGAGTNVSTLYDDIYVSWGANSAARIELGNASTYAACTDLAICEPLSWSNSSLSVKIREGGLSLSANTWLYVTLPDNSTQYSYQVVTA